MQKYPRTKTHILQAERARLEAERRLAEEQSKIDREEAAKMGISLQEYMLKVAGIRPWTLNSKIAIYAYPFGITCARSQAFLDRTTGPINVGTNHINGTLIHSVSVARAAEREAEREQRRAAEDALNKKVQEESDALKASLVGKRRVHREEGKEASLGFTFKKVAEAGVFEVSKIKDGGFAQKSGLIQPRVSLPPIWVEGSGFNTFLSSGI
jgi:hypothetical protein